MAKIDELRGLIDSLRTEYEKFDAKGNAVAGTRSRKILQDIKTIAQDLRTSIQERKREKEMLGE
ncbi:MAG: histone H1 [Fibrobacteria bacterium]|nr:histone H1 [Fibrobacteria bacterium]